MNKHPVFWLRVGGQTRHIIMDNFEHLSLGHLLFEINTIHEGAEWKYPALSLKCPFYRGLGSFQQYNETNPSQVVQMDTMINIYKKAKPTGATWTK